MRQIRLDFYRSQNNVTLREDVKDCWSIDYYFGARVKILGCAPR